ncbi:Mucin-associated surface protein (MASP) [Trypanosoma cruzi]|uniref:Mucin-associated surface protein (MASP), putative n=2 Tax=Trypanosoma cruzi TaxID=5693 RepID=Q4CQD2_TRYCC|nr:mucin-associated surface protein (MASP), putative [Trypanosoma cruzi]EAN82482.1 mucin-associated surface protein (MASP), putative [Trypanosoma cruzi]PWU88338.1 Mucin-associated surface protein (MASP) [Trypanosoma cruzi]|eukprot:XP_804333.1 mucin-associated surface protein (MASP) [Trypanosoma cruzi strain CL Brener]
MAMMMAGRVLLVCALCVLWCGASVVLSAAGGFTSDRSDTAENMVLLWYPETNKTCKENSTKGGILDESAFKSCMHKSMKEICEVYYNMASTDSDDPEAEEICKKYTGDPVEAAESSTPQDKLSPGAETPVAAPTPETSKGGAAEMGSTPGIPAGDSPANPTEGSQSTSDANDTANSEAEKGITEVMPKNAPESNATGKEEEKRNERNHNNTKTTPLDADAMQRITSSADSDSSTAVSHATSPLLPPLLLVVACAAAAAVVAA